MLRKRLIGVVTVKNGWAVQSFGYNRYLPLGKPECLVENLDRWGADEILIQEIDRSKRSLGPNFTLIEGIAKQGITTPLMYAGGIQSQSDAVQLVRMGIERVCLDSVLQLNPQVVYDIAVSLGSQALVASVPAFKNNKNHVQWYDYQSQQGRDISQPLQCLIREGIISELLFIDKCHEGKAEGFDFELLSLVKALDIPLILFGGLGQTDQLQEALLNPNVAAVAIGNYLNYREHEIQRIRQILINLPIRKPHYQTYGYQYS